MAKKTVKVAHEARAVEAMALVGELLPGWTVAMSPVVGSMILAWCGCRDITARLDGGVWKVSSEDRNDPGHVQRGWASGADLADALREARAA